MSNKIKYLMRATEEVDGYSKEAYDPPKPPKPTRCRVFLPGKGQLAIIGPGCNAFDAEFDWGTLTAMGKVEGYDVLVHVSQANITFYRD